MTVGALVYWVLVGGNLALAGVNVLAARRLHRSSAGLLAARVEVEAHQAALSDLIERLTTGQILVTADDGAVGVLAMEPAGDGNIRLSVVARPEAVH